MRLRAWHAPLVMERFATILGEASILNEFGALSEGLLIKATKDAAQGQVLILVGGRQL